MPRHYGRGSWPRWYDRENWPFAIDKATVRQYAKFVSVLPWQLFATLTFSRTIGDAKAGAVFHAFMSDLEYRIKHPIAWIRGSEMRWSGCGQPHVPRHYHLVMASAGVLDPLGTTLLWEEYAGRRRSGISADIRVYTSAGNAVHYCLKLMLRPGSEWDFANLDLFTEVGGRLSSRRRRRLRRHGITAAPVGP
jgi:hypothetical protein